MTERRKTAPQKVPKAPKEAQKLASRTAFEHVGRALAGEGFPKTETPEEKQEVPEESPRDEASPLETPEEPEARSRPTRLRHRATKAVEAPRLGLFAAKAPKSAPLTPLAPEVVALFDHVANNPVDSHAPAWGPRQSNPSGGYS